MTCPKQDGLFYFFEKQVFTRGSRRIGRWKGIDKKFLAFLENIITIGGFLSWSKIPFHHSFPVHLYRNTIIGYWWIECFLGHQCKLIQC